MNTKLFIPTKIKVGFQKRANTFTGFLSYIIYFDEKNVLRKQTSWENWRDKTIEPIEFENTPRNSYILNKGIHRFNDWGGGRSVVRIHDPRNFEFEITLDNLIGILMHSDVLKRDIQEECVYAWSGSDLVLLPVTSEQYKASMEYTEKQSLKVSAKSLVKGARYNKKKSDDILTYIGYYDWYERNWKKGITHEYKGKKHVFHNGSDFVTQGISVLSNIVSDDIVDNYAELVEAFFDSIHSQKIVGLICKVGEIDIIKNNYVDDSYDLNRCSRITGDSVFDSINFYRLKLSEPIKDTSYSQYNYIYNLTNSFSFQQPTRNDYYGYRQAWQHPYYTRPLFVEISREAYRLGYTDLIMTNEQHKEVLTNLGYGRLYLILEDGTEVPFDTNY